MNPMLRSPLTVTLLALAPTACSLSPELPEQLPALADMEEPLRLRAEPADEAARAAMPAGTFSGLYLRDARETREAKLSQPPAVVVDRVVENSPAARAGLQPGDLLLEVEAADRVARPVRAPSEWRKLELGAQPGDVLRVFVDRAGREAEVDLTLTERVMPAARTEVERFREETRVGVVFRGATEVEARAAGLGPGGGAVIVGMSARSPWREAGLRYEDVIVAVDGVELTHPELLLTTIRNAAERSLRLTVARAGREQTVTAALTTRDSSLRELSLPPVFRYEAERGNQEWSLLLGLVRYRSTAAAWRCRVLWVFAVAGGDADELIEAGS